MVTDDQIIARNSSEGAGKMGNRGPWFQAAALLLVLSSLAGMGFLMFRWFNPPAADKTPPQTTNSYLFHAWPKNRKPDLVLVFTGQQQGYLQPCGCSDPQKGGLERRFIFLKGLKEKGWPLLLLDLGDVAQHKNSQDQLKYQVSMEALKILGYTAVALGENELNMPLDEAVGQYALNEHAPRVLAANLAEKFGDAIGSWTVVGGKDAMPKVAIAGLVGQSVIQKVPEVKFDDNRTALPKLLNELANKKPEIKVLLYQGSVGEGKRLASQFPSFDVIQCRSDEEEPRSDPDHAEKAPDTMIIDVGHKGRCLGLVGVFRSKNPDKPFDLYYQLVHMDPEYKTPPGKDADNPILARLGRYAEEVKKKNYLGQYPKMPHNMQGAFPGATFVGSEACKSCHKDPYKVWKKSAHSHAYKSLVEAKRPGLRQFDGECITCHVVGFQYTGGFVDEKTTPHLLDNGCENCHGPGSEHVKFEKQKPGSTPKQMLKDMNPFKAPETEDAQAKDKRLKAMEQSCRKCHDDENDVHWDFARKWKEIEH